MPRSAPLSAPWRRRWRALAATLLLVAAGAVQAQSDADDSADPPSRVARLSYIAGDLGFLPAGATDWSDANINRPLTTGDKLSTARDARAELEFGGGTLRIDGQTNLGLLDLNDELAQIELTQGTLSLTVRRLDDGQSYEIDTPTVALVVDQPGHVPCRHRRPRRQHADHRTRRRRHRVRRKQRAAHDQPGPQLPLHRFDDWPR